MFIKLFIKVFDLVLSEDHGIQLLTLMRKVSTQLLNSGSVVFDPGLNGIQLSLLLHQDLILRLGIYVKPLFPFLLLHRVCFGDESLEFLNE